MHNPAEILAVCTAKKGCNHSHEECFVVVFSSIGTVRYDPGTFAANEL